MALIGYQTPFGIKFLNVLTTGNDYWQAWFGLNEFKFGDAGDDTMIGNTGNDWLAGGDDDDEIHGGGGDDNLFGDAGDDTLVGGIGLDNLFGGSGDDTLVAGQTTTFTIASELDAVFDKGGMMDGGAGDDTIIVDVFFENWLAIDGGTDKDVLDFSRQSNVWSSGPPAGLPTNLVDLESGVGETPFGGSMTVMRIEDIKGSEYRDEFYGDDNANFIRGLGNDDVLEGRGGADRLDGGTGYDVAQYTSASSGVTVDLALTTQAASRLAGFFIVSNGDAAGDILTSIEELRGSRFDDVLRGRSGGGLPSNEKFVGDNGNDTIEGRFGADTIDGGSGFDFASYEHSAGGVNVGLARPGLASSAQFNDAAGDTLTNIEGLIGSAYADTLVGNDDRNELLGGGGADTLSGLGGNDTLRGGAGSDSITGGLGRDVMFGDANADTFKFFDRLESRGTFAQRDAVMDFDRDAVVNGVIIGLGDTIDLSQIDSNILLNDDQAFSFIGSQAFTAAGQLRVTSATDTANGVYSLVEADMNGDRIADFHLSVFTNNDTLLSVNDFLL